MLLEAFVGILYHVYWGNTTQIIGDTNVVGVPWHVVDDFVVH